MMPIRVMRMPRRLALGILFSALICAVGGCNAPQSVNPFYLSQDVVFDSSLLGEWHGADPSEKGNVQTEADGMYFVVSVHTVIRMHHDGQKLSLLWSEEDETLNIFKKEDEASKAKRLAREKRQHDILTMSTERLQQEVLGSPPRGTRISETTISLVRKK